MFKTTFSDYKQLLSAAMESSKSQPSNFLEHKSQRHNALHLQQVIENKLVGSPRIYLTLSPRNGDASNLALEELTRIIATMCITMARKFETHIWLYAAGEDEMLKSHLHAILCSEHPLPAGITRWIKKYLGRYGYVYPELYKPTNLSGIPRESVHYTYSKHEAVPFTVFCPRIQRCCRGKKGCLYERHPERMINSSFISPRANLENKD